MKLRKIINNFLKGTASEEEVKDFKDYLDGTDHEALKQQMEEDWHQDQDWNKRELSPDLSETMLQRILEKIKATRSKNVPVADRNKDESNKVIRLKRWKFAAAAAVTALVVSSLGLTYFWSQSTNSTITFESDYGEWKTLRLPDSTIVKLNANTRLTTDRVWKKGSTRKVYLEGEAFFKVAKDRMYGSHFLVQTKDLTVEVLGTAFNVHSRGEETQVFLEEGQVKLEMGNDTSLLVPGDFIAYSAEKQTITAQNRANKDQHSSWKDGAMICKNQSVQEILKKIEELYGVQTKIEAPEIFDLQDITIRIPMDKLEIAIPIMERAFQTEISRQGNLLILK